MKTISISGHTADDASLEDIFTIQSEIARNVAESLKVKLLAKEKERTEKIPTSNVEAHDMYLRGLFFRERVTKEGFEQAIRCFEGAIEKDPKYSLAYAEIASCYSFLGFFEIHPSVEAFRNAKEYAEKALALDPLLPEAHVVISIVLANSWNFADAVAESRRAVELNPNLAMGHNALSVRLMMIGKYEESISEARKALELDPKSPRTCSVAGTSFLYAGRYDDAIECFKVALEINPDMTLARDNLGVAFAQKGMFATLGFPKSRNQLRFPMGVTQSESSILRTRM